MDRLEEIRERAERATGKGWYAQAVNRQHYTIWNHGQEAAGAMCRLDRESKYHRSRDNARADADFIAHAREDIPYLLERVDELERENERLEAYKEELKQRIQSQAAALQDIKRRYFAEIDRAAECEA